MENVFSYLVREEIAYQTLPVEIIEGYDWSMFQHIKLSVLYINGQLETGKTDDKPVKNIILPILNLQHRATGFDVKDIVLFVNSIKNSFKSFLVKKYHDIWARQNNIDTFIDGMVESYVDLGGALVKKINKAVPEVVPLQSLAFCDQTDILSGAICQKHFYSVDQLLEKKKNGWKNLEEVIALSRAEKESDSGNRKKKTPSKHIKVYELHGVLPTAWLNNEDSDDDEDEYTRQLQIIVLRAGSKQDEHNGIILYSGKESENPYKLIKRDEIYGRALGRGGAEELFEPQVWTTYDEIRIKEMLDIAANTIFTSTDSAIARRNKNIGNLAKGTILEIEDGKTFTQVNTYPTNMVAFERDLNNWQLHAQQLGAATDPILGNQPPSGTPFKLQELLTAEANSLHEYRRGKLATFLGEVYRDWIIPYISREVVKGQEFLADLDYDEMQGVVDAVITNEANNQNTERVLNGEDIIPNETLMADLKEEFFKTNRKPIEILRDEMKDAPIDVEVSIVGKQKNLAGITEKLTNIFRMAIANPQGFQQIMAVPGMSKTWNEILEFSGLSPINYYQKPQMPQIGQQGEQMPQTVDTQPLITAP